jgi:hypothetical protein
MGMALVGVPDGVAAALGVPDTDAMAEGETVVVEDALVDCDGDGDELAVTV